MEIHYSFQSNREHNHGYGSNEEEEEDAFYEELRRQILLLMADDNEDHGGSKSSSVVYAGKVGPNSSVTSFSSGLQPGSHFNWLQNETDSVPAWLVNLWRSGNGTGVFIPHIIKSRRRQRARMTNEKRMYRRVQNK